LPDIALASVWYWSSELTIGHWLTIAIFVVSVLFVWIPVTLILLRVVVYFRDGYRATSYGVPDLVEIIRQIDKKLGENKDRKRVQLSFIGHSMGAYVVTSVVRILSDVFDPNTMRSGLNSTDASPSPEIGHAFQLARLVLVSPDIPAETLISNRANFLSASLLRFKEAFLFSNEGDEVLRQISTTANYFSFPTKSNKFGYRLGNVCLPEIPRGITEGVDRTLLQIGGITLDEIYKKLNVNVSSQLRDDLPKRFSYFDCTDCVENAQGGVENGKGMLTLAKPGLVKKMGPYDHFSLLLRYIWNRNPDVHGGYFRSKFLSELIYRLACIGYQDTVQAYEREGVDLNRKCQDHQVKALLTNVYKWGDPCNVQIP
jgi:pimeloyl-ACP methyl ester carboxylesterase